ncbi:hypothetical protein HID58_096245, partial [Brassica napus]
FRYSKSKPREGDDDERQRRIDERASFFISRSDDHYRFRRLVDDYSFRESQKEGETRREVEELRRKLAVEKKRMNRVKLCSSMELLLLVVLVLLLSTFFLLFFLPSP